MNNHRRLTKKQTIRVLLALTILAWATQTLVSQWALGQEIGGEKFVPGSPRFDAGATLELRSEATIVGEEVFLRQVCRWTQQDQSVLAPLGDMVLARIGPGAPFRSITLEEIKTTLRDAGVNIAALNFVGAAACTVNRSDVEYDERTALSQWIAAKEATTQPAESIDPAPASAIEAEPSTIRSLRKILIEDLSQRLRIPAATMQVEFRAEDQKLLVLAEPLFSFTVEPARVRGLGDVSWQVQIAADGKVQKATVRAHARAWQNQLVAARPLAVKQVIRDEDLIERRTLAEKLTDDPLVTREQVVGQQAARELSVGTVLTARMIDPVQLVKPGQYVTISLKQGNVQIKSVAKALEGGSYGQTIRVKNETTKDTFQVVLTGPQMATMTLSAPQNLAAARE